MAGWGERPGRVRAGGLGMVCLRRSGLLLLILDNGGYASSDYHAQQGYMPSRASTPTFTEGSREGHRGREPYVS